MLAPRRHSLDTLSAIALGGATYVIPYFLLSSWWRFIPSTVIILALGAVFLRGGVLRFFGLRLSTRDILASLALLLVALLLSRYVSKSYVGAFLEIVRTPGAQAQAHQLFQVFNDELVMRAALLTLLLGIMPRPRIVILAMAALFSVGHWVFYNWLDSPIGSASLVTLFSFGVIGNTLFVKYGHIGYGLALHYAWNFYRFNARYSVDGHPLREGATFNYIEGDAWIVTGSVIVMLFVFGAYATAPGQSSSIASTTLRRQ